MLSKSQISFIKSLHHKKYRKEHGLFLVEGMKSITEFLSSEYIVQSIYSLSDTIPNLPKLSHKQKIFEVSNQILEHISTLHTHQNVLALVQIPEQEDTFQINENEITLVLDEIQDPGNLGTIIRTADWFGFKQIICSENTVDAYNPKVVQATMGSLSRIKMQYTDLNKLLSNCQLPILGTLLNGENIYKVQWPKSGFLVLGNEGKGISEEISSLLTKAITIPGSGQTESLNVAISAAICCSEIKRNYFK